MYRERSLCSDISVVIERGLDRLPVIRGVLGRVHSVYASSLDPGYSYRLDLFLGDVLVGQAVVYYMRGGRGGLGVVYYVAIEEGFRGRGLGKILVASAEEVFESEGLDYSIATIRGDNTASLRLFTSLDYEIVGWDRLERVCGEDIGERLLRVSCGYDDDYVALKSLIDRGRGLEGLCRVVGGLDEEIIERHWYRTCYMPWRSVRGL